MISLDYLEKQLEFLKEELQKLDVSQQQMGGGEGSRAHETPAAAPAPKPAAAAPAPTTYTSYKSNTADQYINDFYSKVLIPAQKNLTHRLCDTKKEKVKAIRIDGDGDEYELNETTGNLQGYPADNPPLNAFDNNYRAGGWYKSSYAKSMLYAPNTDWLGYKFKIEYGGEAWTHQNGGFFNGLWLVSGNNAPERDPVKFRVFGSAVDGDYEEIVPETNLPTFDQRTQSMLIAMPKAHEKHYLYYRVLFKTAPGSSGYQSFQLSEMRITALNYWDELKYWMDKSGKSSGSALRDKQLAFVIDKSGVAQGLDTLEKKLQKMVEIFGADGQNGFPTK